MTSEPEKEAGEKAAERSAVQGRSLRNYSTCFSEWSNKEWPRKTNAGSEDCARPGSGSGLRPNRAIGHTSCRSLRQRQLVLAERLRS